jgi:hypothetical protein
MNPTPHTQCPPPMKLTASSRLSRQGGTIVLADDGTTPQEESSKARFIAVTYGPYSLLLFAGSCFFSYLMNNAIHTVSAQLPSTPVSDAAAAASASASSAASAAAASAAAAAAAAAGVDGWAFGPTKELRDQVLAQNDGAGAGGT